MITQAELFKVLDYNPLSGEFTWKVNASQKKAGDKAGYTKGRYSQIGIGGRLFLAHRLAWLIFHGAEPEFQIDHRNQVKSDNRIANLRHATVADN